jgi:hypothetical protein
VELLLMQFTSAGGGFRVHRGVIVERREEHPDCRFRELPLGELNER